MSRAPYPYLTLLSRCRTFVFRTVMHLSSILSGHLTRRINPLQRTNYGCPCLSQKHWHFSSKHRLWATVATTWYLIWIKLIRAWHCWLAEICPVAHTSILIPPWTVLDSWFRTLMIDISTHLTFWWQRTTTKARHWSSWWTVTMATYPFYTTMIRHPLVIARWFKWHTGRPSGLAFYVYWIPSAIPPYWPGQITRRMVVSKRPSLDRVVMTAIRVMVWNHRLHLHPMGYQFRIRNPLFLDL